MSLKLVITGASGHIGTHVCQRIGNHAHVVALVGSAEGRERASCR